MSNLAQAENKKWQKKKGSKRTPAGLQTGGKGRRTSAKIALKKVPDVILMCFLKPVEIEPKIANLNLSSSSSSSSSRRSSSSSSSTYIYIYTHTCIHLTIEMVFTCQHDEMSCNYPRFDPCWCKIVRTHDALSIVSSNRLVWAVPILNFGKCPCNREWLF